MQVKEIEYKEAINFLLPRHYSGRKPQIKWAFGLFIDEKLSAVCSFGKPASNSLCIGVCGKEFSDKVYELNRLCREDDVTYPMSKFISQCLRELKKHNLIIVSYADTGMNHIGKVYQATNFLYTGKTKERTDKYTEGNKHSRHYDKDKKEIYRKVRTAKHRYVKFVANKTERKIYEKNLNYKIEDYPKGNSLKYKLGDYQKAKIIKIVKDTNKDLSIDNTK